jgi:putative transcriptional regulator
MSVSYNKLWKLLIDKNMNKTMLREKAKLSSSTIAKLGKNENVTTDVLVKICRTLKCDIGDIIEIADK